ncbi:osteoclast stimulatory transmembrane protein [Spea bombifrons]|uniref:osteoclast stimulatory transmembrane protein n=1 Tax=Spea bombifrons TaxID=233779 RepID=UPI00234B7B65|nr:osteoclast stimulatory transmembrane protein [Spea bombifrons]
MFGAIYHEKVSFDDGHRKACWNFTWTILMPRSKGFFKEVWFAYSRPVPADRKQLLMLIVACALFSVFGGIFLHQWLCNRLHYNPQSMTILSTIVVLLTVCVLVLVHPIRCVLTIVLPMVGSKQCRNLLWSTCFMVIMFNILPNIATNIQAVFQTIKCVSQHSLESVLNSTHHFRVIVENTTGILTKVTDEMAKMTLTPITRRLSISANVETSLIESQILKTSKNIKEDFAIVQFQFKDTALTCNRILEGCFIFYVLFNASLYLKRYLTDLEFDNSYITKQLEELAVEKKVSHLLMTSSKRLIKSTGLKLSKEELCTCLVHVLTMSLFILMTVPIVVADHVVFHFGMVVVEWVDNLPPIHITLQMKYEVNLKTFLVRANIPYENNYPWKMTFVSSNCRSLPNPPNVTILVTFGFIFCLMFIMILLEAYAHRLCRKISASFYEKREEERVSHLLEKIMHKTDDDVL